MVIGLSGFAKVGKDTFCNALIKALVTKGYSAKRFALADELKKKLNPFLIQECGIDIFNCSPQEKETVRDILVAYGKVKRLQSQGRFWTSILEEIIWKESHDFSIVTDVRYDFFPNDEVWWIKSQMSGILIHLNRGGIKPPNKDEEINDPKIAAQADFDLIFPNLPEDKIQEFVDIFCDRLCKHLQTKNLFNG